MLHERFIQIFNEALSEPKPFLMINLWNVTAALPQLAKRALYALRVRNTSLRTEM